MATDKEQSNTPHNSIEPGDLGKLLKSYRDDAELNIDQIADALCLTPSSIKSLENELFDKLPESPYVRGYLRHYARLANKDAKPLLDIYNSLRGVPAASEETLLSNTTNSQHEFTKPLITPQRFKLALLASLLLLLAILTMIPGVRDWTSHVWNSFSSSANPELGNTNEDEDNDKDTLNLPSLTGDVPGNLPIAPEETPEQATSDTSLGAQTSSSTDETNENNQGEESGEQEKSDKLATKNVANEQQKNATTTAETTNTDSPLEATSTEAPAGSTSIKMVFAEEVWIRIRDDENKTVYEALHPAGTEKELSLNGGSLKFKIGNAPGMALFVNGKEMDITQFTKGSVADFGIE